MSTQKEFDALFDHAVKFARKMMLTTGSVSTMIIGYAAHELLPIMGELEALRVMADSGKLRELFRDRGVTEFVFVSEVWVAMEKPDANKRVIPHGPPPSRRPDRQEGVFVYIESKEHGRRAVMLAIKREGGKVGEGKVIDVPQMEGDAPDQFAGRFCGILDGKTSAFSAAEGRA